MPARDVRLRLECIHEDVDIVIAAEDVLVGVDELWGETFAEGVHAIATEDMPAEDVI